MYQKQWVFIVGGRFTIAITTYMVIWKTKQFENLKNIYRYKKLAYSELALSDALNTFKTRKKVSYFFVSTKRSV